MHLSASFELLDRFYFVKAQFRLTRNTLSKKMTTLKNLTKIDFRATKVSFSRSFGFCSQVGGSSGVFLLSLGSFMAFRNGHVFRGRPKR